MKMMKTLTASALLVSAFACHAASTATIDKIVMFGDSLSDNGNVYAITKSMHDTLPAVPVIPQDGIYYHGRFSNGPVWVENLAQNMNVELKDFAYGGSWAEPITVSKLSMPINLGMQVNFFLVEAATDFNTSKHLYVIWSGANDYIKGRSDADFATTNTVAVIKEQIDWLKMYGAKNFLILDLPDLSTAPQSIAKGPAFVAEQKALTVMHNRKLEAMVNEEQSANPDDKFIFADLTAYMDDVIENPTKYNLKNTKDACFGGGYYNNLANLVNASEIDSANNARIDIMNNSSMREAYLMSKLSKSGVKPCVNPDEYLFWDHLHPTRIMHQIISTTAQQLLYSNGVTGSANSAV